MPCGGPSYHSDDSELWGIVALEKETVGVSETQKEID